MKQRGFTLTELVSVILSLGVMGLVVWVLWHFIAKFW